MAVQRFRSEVDRTRRVLGAILIALALVLIQWLIRVEITAGRVTVTALESLARAWGVPCRSLGGTVRGPDQLCAGSSSPTAARTGSCSARMTRSSSTSG